MTVRKITFRQWALLQSGAVAAIHVDRARLACETVRCPAGGLERRFVMSGPSGQHSLLCVATDVERLNAHWKVFAADPANRYGKEG